VIFAFPMAGEGRRFVERGYAQPKYALMTHGAPLFDHAVRSFCAYFGRDTFLFIARDADGANFAATRCAQLGVPGSCVVALKEKTAGQAQTVLLGLEMAGVADSEALAVFNIDTFRPGFRKPAPMTDPACDGYLEVFRGTGEGWSFVAADEEGNVIRVVEKDPISDLCCTGLYYFRRAADFRWAYRNPPPPQSPAEQRERYVAPLYNALIARGNRIGLEVIASDEAIFCGTPEQYEQIDGSEEIGQLLRP
jgi:hypothetical protein